MVLVWGIFSYRVFGFWGLCFMIAAHVAEDAARHQFFWHVLRPIKTQAKDATTSMMPQSVECVCVCALPFPLSFRCLFPMAASQINLIAATALRMPSNFPNADGDGDGSISQQAEAKRNVGASCSLKMQSSLKDYASNGFFFPLSISLPLPLPLSLSLAAYCIKCHINACQYWYSSHPPLAHCPAFCAPHASFVRQTWPISNMQQQQQQQQVFSCRL